MNIVQTLLAIDAKEIEMPKGTHKMFCKKIKQELEFEIQAIDPERVAKIQEDAIDLSQGEIDGIDTYSLKVFTIIEGCPIFKDAELQKHFEAHTPKELVKKLLLSGEMDSLNNAINDLNGVEKDEKELKKKVKN
jgi:hypothetical protein